MNAKEGLFVVLLGYRVLTTRSYIYGNFACLHVVRNTEKTSVMQKKNS